MIASTTRERHGGGRNIIESAAMDKALPSVTPGMLAARPQASNGKRKGFTICRCAQGGALLPFPARR